MMPDRSDHHPFCSGCNLSPGCTDWTLCARRVRALTCSRWLSMADAAEKQWCVLTDEEAKQIAKFSGITVEKVRGVELLVLMKVGAVEIETTL
jgi:hypothetical protein